MNALKIFIILLLAGGAASYLSGQKHYYSKKTLQLIKKGDTIDFDFYDKNKRRYTVEWRKYPKDYPYQTSDEFYYIKVFRIKNNFNHSIYLRRTQTSLTPGGFVTGLLRPDSVEYSSLYFDLDKKPYETRGVLFNFSFCPDTPEEEVVKISYTFTGNAYPTLLKDIIKTGDTLNFDFYNESCENMITLECHDNPEPNNILRDNFYYLKVFRIKNPFNYDIYLNHMWQQDTLDAPEFFPHVLLKPDSVAYGVVGYDLTQRPAVNSEVLFSFKFCPDTPEEEMYETRYTFVGEW